MYAKTWPSVVKSINSIGKKVKIINSKKDLSIAFIYDLIQEFV
jgi:hypothetical protein